MKRMYYLGIIIIMICALLIFFLIFRNAGYYGIEIMVNDASSSINEFMLENIALFSDHPMNVNIFADCEQLDCSKIPDSNCAVHNCTALINEERIIHSYWRLCPSYSLLIDTRLSGIDGDLCPKQAYYGQITTMPILPNKVFEYRGTAEFFTAMHFDNLYKVEDYVAQIGSFYFRNKEDAKITYDNTKDYLHKFLRMNNNLLLHYNEHNYKDGMITATFMTNYVYRNETSRPVFHFMMYLDNNKLFLYREYSPYIYPMYNYKNIINNKFMGDAALRVHSLYLENYHHKNYSVSIIDGLTENAKCPFDILKIIHDKDASYLCNNQSYYGLFLINTLSGQEKLSDTIKNSPEYSIILGIPYNNSNDAITAFSSIKTYTGQSTMFLDTEELDISMISNNMPGSAWNDFLMTTHYMHLEDEEDYFIHMIMGRIDNTILVMVEKNSLQSRKYNLGRTTKDSESINDYVSGRMQTIKDLSVSMIE